MVPMMKETALVEKGYSSDGSDMVFGHGSVLKQEDDGFSNKGR